MEIACYVSLSQDLPVKWLYWGIVKGITEPIVLILFSAIFHTGLCDILSDLLVSLILSFRKSCREVWGCAWCSAGIGSQLYTLFSWSIHNVVTSTYVKHQLWWAGSSTVQHVCSWYTWDVPDSLHMDYTANTYIFKTWSFDKDIWHPGSWQIKSGIQRSSRKNNSRLKKGSVHMIALWLHLPK